MDFIPFLFTALSSLLTGFVFGFILGYVPGVRAGFKRANHDHAANTVPAHEPVQAIDHTETLKVLQSALSGLTGIVDSHHRWMVFVTNCKVLERLATAQTDILAIAGEMKKYDESIKDLIAMNAPKMPTGQMFGSINEVLQAKAKAEQEYRERYEAENPKPAPPVVTEPVGKEEAVTEADKQPMPPPRELKPVIMKRRGR